MVERLEGFCSENDWMRAYNEINEFEKELHDWGAVIIKFWVQIDKDTQLERFNERQNTPENSGRSRTRTGATVINGMRMRQRSMK